MRFLMTLKSKPALHPERRSAFVMLMGSALFAYGRFDRRVDADMVASGLLADLTGIPPHLPIPLQVARPGTRLGPHFKLGPQRLASSGRPICGEGLGTLVEALPAGLPPARGALL